MSVKTNQMNTWAGEFGENYTSRNRYSPQELDEMYIKSFGESRTAMNNAFLAEVPKDARILEVGSNVGNQLAHLKKAGFTNLIGVELQAGAAQTARARDEHLQVIEGSAFELPFRDGWFDLVFTSGVLIHISPDDVGRAQAEMVRCSSKWIWGFEYFAEEYQEVEYRGNAGLLWKTDFAKLFCDSCPPLSVIKTQKFEYQDESGNVDQMYLLEK